MRLTNDISIKEDDVKTSNAVSKDSIQKKVSKVAKDYINSMASYSKKLDHKTDTTHERILNDILSFITKKAKKKKTTSEFEENRSTNNGDNNNASTNLNKDNRFVVDITNQQIKAMELRERKFALKFWSKLGLDNVNDKISCLLYTSDAADE